MSKITQAKKEGKLKGKPTAKSAADGNDSAEVKKSSKCLNYGKCCTCAHYPYHKRGEAQPCKISKSYVARKAEHPECYKCKF